MYAARPAYLAFTFRRVIRGTGESDALGDSVYNSIVITETCEMLPTAEKCTYYCIYSRYSGNMTHDF